MKEKKKCPVCGVMRVYLSYHMRSMHRWSDEKPRKVCLTQGLRKSYIWHVERPKRQKTVNQKKTEKKNETSKAKDYYTRKWCPISGFLTITVKMSAHLNECRGRALRNS